MAGGFNPWTNRCIYHDDEACLYGLCTGMVGAAICLSNLFCDARLHRIIMIDTRQKVIQMDIILSCAMSIVCFAGFCLLANVYFTNKVHESSSDEYLEENSVLAIVFSGLSVFPWVSDIFLIHDVKWQFDQLNLKFLCISFICTLLRNVTNWSIMVD